MVSFTLTQSVTKGSFMVAQGVNKMIMNIQEQVCIRFVLHKTIEQGLTDVH